LARQGFAILLHYHHSEEEAAATADAIRALGMPVYPVQADLTSSTNIESLFSTLDTLPHPLKVLVNSAALMPRGDVRTLSAADFDAAIALNLRAPFLCAQEAAKRMDDGGLIVNVTDIGAQKAWSGFPAYTVSKAGLESLTRVLARSLAPMIRVNAIAPGLVLPSEYVSEEEWKRLVERLPLKRPASVDEITSALEFLLENEYITGQTIVVDGGYSLL
jgi:NAD(P)-dependent dehydrogenase (short-subunit alcohol dehydrogenase family)